MLKLLSYIYAFIIQRRNFLFDNNKIKAIHCKKIVISIGNISVGGTGKTPFVISLGQILKENDIKFAVVGKGYKRKSKGEIIVSDGKKILTDSKTAGDEMLLIAEALNVPVIVNEKKYLAALSADKLFDIDCILVDDGFQHRKLYRDLDIVIIDNDTLIENNLLPSGRLREYFNSLKRADVIVLKDLVNPNIDKISDFIQSKILISAKTKAGKVYKLISNEKVNDLDKLDFIAISGIAKPQNFIKLLQGVNLNIIKSLDYSDHHNFAKKEISRIINTCKELSINNLAITEKDAVKLIEFGNVFANNNIECYVFPISINIETGKDILIKGIKDLLLI